MSNLSIQFEYDDMYAEQDAAMTELLETPYDRYVLGEKWNDMYGFDYYEEDNYYDEPEEPFFTSLNPWDAPGMSIKDFL